MMRDYSQGLVVLISGNGSNLNAMIEQGLGSNIKAVIANNPEAKGLQIAHKAGIATYAVDNNKYSSRFDFELNIIQIIDKYSPRFIILAGFMRILSANFVNRYHNSIINIHPSLLPSFKGLNPQKRALESGVKISGVTIHLVDKDVDHGRIIAQAITSINALDTVEELSQRIRKLEHVIYPFIISKLLNNEIVIDSDTHINVKKSKQDTQILGEFQNHIFY